VSGFTISNSNSTSIEYEIARLRPEQHLALDPVVLLWHDTAANALEAMWTITAGNVNGGRGMFTVIRGAPLEPTELLPELHHAARERP